MIFFLRLGFGMMFCVVGERLRNSIIKPIHFPQKIQTIPSETTDVPTRLEIILSSKPKKGRKQAPVQQQLAILLTYFGTEGDGASNYGQRNKFFVGYGSSASLYRSRVV
jgi:hypothetical protein